MIGEKGVFRHAEQYGDRPIGVKDSLGCPMLSLREKESKLIHDDRSPLHPETLAVKRVIALEGDTVITRSPYPIAEQQISIGHVWVEGEHPEHTRWSYDSNSYGAVCNPFPSLTLINIEFLLSSRKCFQYCTWLMDLLAGIEKPDYGKSNRGSMAMESKELDYFKGLERE